MKLKKKIIMDNIEEKKKLKKIKKNIIEDVLNKLEKNLQRINKDRNPLIRYRKEISEINTRMKNLLMKENLIFRKNKIKI